MHLEAIDWMGMIRAGPDGNVSGRNSTPHHNHWCATFDDGLEFVVEREEALFRFSCSGAWNVFSLVVHHIEYSGNMPTDQE